VRSAFDYEPDRERMIWPARFRFVRFAPMEELVHHPEEQPTRATARLPGLEIEILHRRSDGAEQISIILKALPSFDACSQLLGSANPFAMSAQAMQMAWLPWLSPVCAPAAPRNDALTSMPPTSEE